MQTDRRSSQVPHGAQAGFVGVGTVIFVALLGVAAYLLLAAFEADPAKFGRVPVPSKGAPVDLPAGGSDIYYAEAVAPDSEPPLSVPPELKFTIVGPDGQGVDHDLRGGDPKEIDGGTARLVGIVNSPAAATYGITVDSDDDGRAGPELTFGESPFQAIESRFDSIVEELDGPTGIAIAAALVLLFLLPRVRRALRAT